jgi:RNA polymerase sigma factor (sigma-70 family)
MVIVIKMVTTPTENGTGNSLAERIREGQESAFEEFRSRYSTAFYYYFRRRGLPESAAIDLAADCVADIPLKVRDRFDSTHTCFEAWVNLLRQRAAANWWRREQRFKTVELDPGMLAPDEEQAESDAELDTAVNDAIEHLEPLDRDLLLLRYGGQMQPSFAEIAAELSKRHRTELKEAGIRQRHARALSKLKARLRHDSRLANVLERIEGPAQGPT